MKLHEYSIRYQGLVRSIAWKIYRKVSKHADLDDLISYGQVGLLEAARDFDETRSVNFTTYAYYRIRGSILDGLSKMSWFNRDDYHRGRYEQVSADFLDQTESPDESNSASVSSNWFSETTNSMAVMYLFCQLQPEISGEIKSRQEDSDPVDICDRQEMIGRLNHVITKLSEQEQSLIRATYFENCTLKEAGERIGYSKAWASRLHARIIKKMATALTE